MIHQIALFQMIPKFRDAIESFEHETCQNLSVCETDREALIKDKKDSTKEYYRVRNSIAKYMVRLKYADKTKKTLADLERSLHE